MLFSIDYCSMKAPLSSPTALHWESTESIKDLCINAHSMLNVKNCRSKTEAFFAERFEGLEDRLKMHYIKLTCKKYFENAPFFDSLELMTLYPGEKTSIGQIHHQKLRKCSCHWDSTDHVSSMHSKHPSKETEADKQHDASEIKICIHVLLLGSLCQYVIKYVSLNHSIPLCFWQIFDNFKDVCFYLQLMKSDLKYGHIFQHHKKMNWGLNLLVCDLGRIQFVSADVEIRGCINCHRQNEPRLSIVFSPLM